MEPERLVTWDRWQENSSRIWDRLDSLQAQIEDIHRRRRTALAEMERNITSAFTEGRAAVEASVAANAQMNRLRIEAVARDLDRVRAEITTLQAAVAAQIGPGRLSALEEDVRQIREAGSGRSLEKRQQRFAVVLALLAGAVSLVVTLVVLGITDLTSSPAAPPAPAATATPSPAGVNCILLPKTGTEICH